MGLFNGYMKEGPGVSKNAPEKHRFFLFFELFGRKFSKLIQLNLMLLICLIPLILGLYLSLRLNPNIIADGVVNTEAMGSQPLIVFSGDIIGLALFIIGLVIAGPAIAGFTYIIRNFQREEHAWLFSDFKDNFKSNFKQATAVAFIDAAVYLLLYVAFVFYTYQLPVTNPEMVKVAPALSAAIAVMAVVYTWMHYYIHVMMVTFTLKLKDIFRNALLFAIGKLPINLLITVICGAIIFLSIYYNMLIGIIVAMLITLSLIGYIVIFTVYPTIDNYLIKPVTPDDDEDDDIPDFSDEREV